MQLTDLHWPDIQALNKDTPIVFPVAALEQHGHHLPLFTDSLLLGEIIRRAAERLEHQVLFAPLLWLGNSDHHLDFPGTLSSPPRAYLDVLAGMLENFIQHGFRRLVFLNGHGGNDVPGRQAVFEVRQRHRQRHDLLLLFATYWQLGARPWEHDPTLQQRAMAHACEWETSMILHLAPGLVGPLDKLEAVATGHGLEPAARGWTTKDRTASGHLGHPRAATAAKGGVLFRAFTDDVVALLERVVRWDGTSWHA